MAQRAKGKQPPRKKRAAPRKASGWVPREGTSKAALLAFLQQGGSFAEVLAKAKKSKITSDNLEGRVRRIAAWAQQQGLIQSKRVNGETTYSATK